MPLPQLVAVKSQVVPAKEEETVVTVIPASDEKTYDKYWMTHLIIAAPSPTEEARIVATLVPARDVTTKIDGKDVTVKELLTDADQVVMVVQNLFARAASDLNFANTLTVVLDELIVMAKEKGIVK